MAGELEFTGAELSVLRLNGGRHNGGAGYGVCGVP